MRAPGWTVATLAWILLMGGACPASASAQTLRRDRSAQPPTTTESITTASEPAANDKVGKELHANRIMGAPPRIDGRVDDEAWMAAETITDFVQDATDRQVLELILYGGLWGRPFGLPPDVPKERVAALRKAFSEMTNDKQFLAEAQKLDVDLDIMAGEQMDAILAKAYAASPAIIEAVCLAPAEVGQQA